MAFPYMYVMHFDHIPLRVYEGMYRIWQVQVRGERNSWCKNGSRKSEVRKKENSKPVWGSLLWGRSLGMQAQVGWVRSRCSDWLIKRTIVLFQNSTRLTRTSPFCLCPQTIDLSSLTTNHPLDSWLVASLAVLRLSLGMGLTLNSRSLSLRLHCLPLPNFFVVVCFPHFSHSSVLTSWFSDFSVCTSNTDLHLKDSSPCSLSKPRTHSQFCQGF